MMPDATEIGIRHELKGILFCGGKGVSGRVAEVISRQNARPLRGWQRP
jgi:hypothetical protein